MEDTTDQQSNTMMRNLLRAGLSSILYQREIFPKQFFQVRKITGIELQQLTPSNEDSMMVCSWMEDGVLEALRYGYLRSMILSISSGNGDEQLECYVFAISYRQGEPVSMEVHTQGIDTLPLAVSKEDARRATVTLIRNIECLSRTLKPLPSSRRIDIRLTYTEFAPKNYEPTHFGPAKESIAYRFPVEPVRVTIGTVSSAQHAFTLRLRATNDKFEGLDKEAAIPENFEATSNEGSSSASSASNSPIHPRRIQSPAADLARCPSSAASATSASSQPRGSPQKNGAKRARDECQFIYA